MEFGNAVFFIGRIVRDLEIKDANGLKVVNFTLARDRRKTKNSENKETDFVDFTAFGSNAEFLAKYFKKGSKVGVYGKITTSYYEKENIKIKNTSVIAEGFEFVESGNGYFKNDNSKEMDVKQEDKKDTSEEFEEFSSLDDDELPF